MMRTTPEVTLPFPSFRTTPAGGRLTPTYDLTCDSPHTRRIETDTLPLGHRGVTSKSEFRIRIWNITNLIYSLQKREN
ncbi:hypothetical protein AVEN_29437-1, partial [Araneus ventricosus]